LCQRGRVGFKVTDRGLVVYNAAKTLFGALADFGGAIDATRGKLTGQLSLGVIDNWVADERTPLVDALARFKLLAPDVQIEFNSLAPDDIEHAVLDGRADVGVGVFHRHRPGLVYEQICTDPVEFYCARGHPLFNQLGNGKPLVGLEAADLARRAYLSEEQVAPKTAHMCSTAKAHQVEGVAFLVLSGKYVGYLPAHYAERWIIEGRMRSVLPEEYRLLTQIEIVTRRGIKLNSVTRTFLKLLKQEAARRDV